MTNFKKNGLFYCSSYFQNFKKKLIFLSFLVLSFVFFFQSLSFAWYGYISGTVRDNLGNAVSNIDVWVFDTSFNFAGEGYTNSSGYYKADYLLAGDYKVYFDPSYLNYSEGRNFAPQWYNSKIKFSEAETVTVPLSGGVTGIDANLKVGSTIEGAVTSTTGIPLAGIEVDVVDTDDFYFDTTYTDSNGQYRINGLCEGDYKVLFSAEKYNEVNGTDYISEWYDNKRKSSEATIITVPSETTVSNIDAQLEVGIYLSGKVVNIVGDPVKDVEVIAYDASFGSPVEKVSYSFTKFDGTYVLHGIPTGTFKVLFYPDWEFDTGWPYLKQWYNNKASYTTANSIEITTLTPVANINSVLLFQEKNACSEARGDFNGDGRDDILVMYGYKDSEGFFDRMALGVFLSNGTSFNYRCFWKDYWEPNLSKLTAGDVDGDGLCDAIVLYDNLDGTSSLWVFYSDGYSFIEDCLWDSPGAWHWSKSKLSAGDVNRDGRADPIILYDYKNSTSGLWAFISKGFSFTPKRFWKSEPGKFNWSKSKLSAGDVNRDGRAEAIVLYDNGASTSSLWVFLSNGSLFTQKRFWKSEPGKFNWSKSKLSAGDVNRDGRAEAIVLYDNGASTSSLWVFLSNGSLFTQKRFWKSEPGKFNWSKSTLSVGDVNKDGRKDAVVFYAYAGRTSAFWTFNSTGTSFSSPKRFWKSETGKWNYFHTQIAP